MGSETQRPAKTEKGRGSQRGEETGGWAGKQGGQELWAKEQVQKGAFSTRGTEW